MRRFLQLACLILLALPAVATTRYVCGQWIRFERWLDRSLRPSLAARTRDAELRLDLRCLYSGGGDSIIFRGGDTWHFGNPSATPYTGGGWNINNWWGTDASCIFESTQTGCIYYGVDQTWYSGGSWSRPILTADNPTSTSNVASCTYQVAGSMWGANTLILMGVATILDNFELTGMCGSRSTVTPGITDVYIGFGGSGTAGTGTEFLENLYVHGWTATASAGSGNSIGAGSIIGGGYNGLQVMDHLVIDGSDSLATSWMWGTYPSFYHFRDSIVRYTADGVGAWCHDIHDNIFEHVSSIQGGGHTNILECNADSDGTAGNQPSNTPNVFYNNIIRHSTSDVGVWFCPNTIPEYWFNSIWYDVNGEGLSVAGPTQYPDCTHTGGQRLFNNIFVDLGQGVYCHGTGSDNTGGAYTTSLNNQLINSTWDGSGCTGGPSSSTNVSLTTAQATTQGYVSGSGTYRTSSCANDSTTPCAPTSSGNSTVGVGGNQQAYCTTLAGYSSEYAIGTEAANACKYGTTDGCAYNSITHTMSCPAQTAIHSAYEHSLGCGSLSVLGIDSNCLHPNLLSRSRHLRWNPKRHHQHK